MSNGPVLPELLTLLVTFYRVSGGGWGQSDKTVTSLCVARAAVGKAMNGAELTVKADPVMTEATHVLIAGDWYKIRSHRLDAKEAYMHLLIQPILDDMALTNFSSFSSLREAG